VIAAVRPVGAGPVPLRAEVARVTTDSREAAEGSLFVALRGERADGADFVEEAFRRGAVAAIVSEEGFRRVPPAVAAANPVLVVQDPVEALGDLALAHRRRLRAIPLVAITGSSGKTSTKEMLAALLGRRRRVHRNEGNRNNLVGMPLALLELSDAHDVAVMELGTNRPGEIARLAAIAAPDVALVTNIAPAHLEGLGSLEGVAREKGDLFRALGEGGTAVVNATDLRVVREAARCGARKVFYGAPLNDFSGRIVSMDDAGMQAAIRTPAGEFLCAIPAPGEHVLQNAVAAAAAAFVLGMPPGDLAGGFAAFASLPGRFRPVPLRGGGLLLDDAYNANPASMEAAIRGAVRLARGRRLVFVLGDMRELGEAAFASHLRIGRIAARAGAARLFAFGEAGELLARGALEEGMDPAAVAHHTDRDRLRDAVLSVLRDGDVVLVKASRAMRLDEIALAVERERA